MTDDYCELYFEIATELEKATGIPRFEWGFGSAVARTIAAHPDLRGYWCRTVEADGGMEVCCEVVGTGGARWHCQHENEGFARLVAMRNALREVGPIRVEKTG